MCNVSSNMPMGNSLSTLVLTVSRIHHWLVVSIPLKNMKVSWGNIFPICGKIYNPNVPNHQPAPYTQYQNCHKIDDILSIPLYTKRVDFHIFQGHVSRQTHIILFAAPVNVPCIPIYDHFCYLDPLKMFKFNSYILRIPSNPATSVAWSWQYPEFTKPPQFINLVSPVWPRHAIQKHLRLHQLVSVVQESIWYSLDGDGSMSVGGAVALGPPVESATVSDVVSGVGFKSSKCCTVSKRRVASSTMVSVSAWR